MRGMHSQQLPRNPHTLKRNSTMSLTDAHAAVPIDRPAPQPCSDRDDDQEVLPASEVVGIAVDQGQTLRQRGYDGRTKG